MVKACWTTTLWPIPSEKMSWIWFYFSYEKDTVMRCTLIRMCSHRVDWLCRCYEMKTICLCHTIESIRFSGRNKCQSHVPDVPNSRAPLSNCCNHLTMCTVRRFHCLVQWKFVVLANDNRSKCSRMACTGIYSANIGPNLDATIHESSYKKKKQKWQKRKQKMTAKAKCTKINLWRTS